MDDFTMAMYLMAEQLPFVPRKKCHICLGGYYVWIDSYDSKRGLWKLVWKCQKLGCTEETYHSTEGLWETIRSLRQ